MPLKYAICSEIFQGRPLAEICRAVRAIGYTGLEIAPFHLFENVNDITPEARAEMRRTVTGEGLEVVGLHWLLVAPKGFHITTNDLDLRRRSWDYLARLIDFCGDLGGTVMILGSPQQRDARDGWTIEDAKSRLAEGLSGLAPRAAERGVTLLMEAVPSDQGNVVTRLADAAEVVGRVNHPNVRTMFDSHNTADETEPLIELLDKYYPLFRHVHVNEMDGRRPGTGEYDFETLLRFLLGRNYAGWVSLEVFDFSEGSEAIARGSLDYLRSLESRIA